MNAGKKARQLADQLFRRIWSQRFEAARNDETFDLGGLKDVAMWTLSLPDGLKIACHRVSNVPTSSDGVYMVLPDRLVKLEFADIEEVSRCYSAIVASQILNAAGYPDARNGRTVALDFRSDHEDILPRNHGRKRTEPYLFDHLDRIAADAIRALSTEHAHTTSFTLPNGMQISYIAREGQTDNGDVWVSHVDVKRRIRVPRRAKAEYATWRMNETAHLLAGTIPPPLQPPPDINGNARLTRALRLCHQALGIDPNLTDDAGTPLRPLLEDHVPELMERHRQASMTADARDMEAIDAELDDGIAGICDAIDQGLSRIADDRRHALREQLAFLEMRHPKPDRLLGIASSG